MASSWGLLFSYIINHLEATYPSCITIWRSTRTLVGFINPEQCQYNFAIPSNVSLTKGHHFMLDDGQTKAHLHTRVPQPAVLTVMLALLIAQAGPP